MQAVVNRRCQITIDRVARERLGVQPGMVAVQQVVAGQLVITFIPGPHDRSVAGRLGPPPRPILEEDCAEARELFERAIAGDIDAR